MSHGRNRRGLAGRLAPAILAFCGAVASGAQAADKDKDPPPARAAAFEAVLACRKLGEGAARLACYDQAARDMENAEASGDIVVIGKAQAARASRETFGLRVPSLGVLTRALAPEEADRYEGVVRSARSNASGQWTLSLEDGAVWRQIDGFLNRPPRAGSTVKIRKGALGSFLMNLDGQTAVKVHRVE